MSDGWVEGAKVAAVQSRGWSSRRTITGPFVIAKVLKNGNIKLATKDGGVDPQQYRQWSGNTALATGSDSYRSDHIELWTPQIEAEIAEQKAVSLRFAKLEKLREAFEKMKPETVTDKTLNALATILLPPTQQEP